MPKTTIDEKCRPLSRKNKIRSTGQRLVAPPTFDLIVAQKRHHRQFRLLVSAASDARHQL
jgi:hypothetical protein